MAKEWLNLKKSLKSKHIFTNDSDSTGQFSDVHFQISWIKEKSLWKRFLLDLPICSLRYMAISLGFNKGSPIMFAFKYFESTRPREVSITTWRLSISTKSSGSLSNCWQYEASLLMGYPAWAILISVTIEISDPPKSSGSY